MVAVMFIGFYVGRREKATVVDYFRASDRLPWYAIGFSIVAAGISSEQFLAEVGYVYRIGLAVANWEWLVFPALSILLWIFVPLYVRNRVATMPEYLERRYGPTTRVIYALLTVTSYVFINFAFVFYTGGFILNQLFGVPIVAGIWLLAVTTGAYTIYGGLTSVAWTDVLQCILLLGGGIFVFFAGLAHVPGGAATVFAEGPRTHLIGHPELPATALIVLALSTNTWYYATNQFINQRCLGAKNEWHARMGVLMAGGLQLFLPLATAIPGMIYYAMNPNLPDPDAAYPALVKAVVPVGVRGIVLATLLGAIMSTVSGLVNSSSTILTLDIYRKIRRKTVSERHLVRFGQIAAAAALVCGALYAPMAGTWETLFRYCQDLWVLMAAPTVVVFLGGAIWRRANHRGAVAAMIFAVATIPFVFIHHAEFPESLPKESPIGDLNNMMILGGVVFILALVIWVVASLTGPPPGPEKISGNVWTRAMLRLPKGERAPWFASVFFWWVIVGACFVGIYATFW